MRVCVVGAGAIGGHLAARLARGGARVSVIARGAQLAAIQAHGLVVEAPEGRLDAPVAASSEPAVLGPQDAVLVTVKTPALPEVAPLLPPLLGPATPVAFVANGIPWWHEASPPHPLHGTLDMARVLGGVVWSACTVVAPGRIRVETAQNRLVLGETRPGLPARAEPLLDALRAGGMEGTGSPNLRRDIWVKLANNLTNGPICLLSRADMRATFQDPALRDAALAVLREVVAIAAAEREDIAEGAEQRALRSIGLPHKPSILQDVEAGRPTEFATLFEAPLAIARARGVKAPMLETLVALARFSLGR